MQKKWGHFHVSLVSHSAWAQLLRLALYPTVLTTRSFTLNDGSSLHVDSVAANCKVVFAGAFV